MTKKQSASSVRDKQTAKSGKHISDEDIDFSDIPESTDEELKHAKRVGRPNSDNPKQLIAIRIDPSLLNKIKKMAKRKKKGYQTLIHELLEEASHVVEGPT